MIREPVRIVAGKAVEQIVIRADRQPECQWPDARFRLACFHHAN
ncbi:hypothetical protein [Burkholderia sp. F1]